ncbi:MAG: hypothetical protein PHC82_02790 [Candidatus Pacebacteria bacterium]|nr:hypothetical protein [Candidatus Paceibacterota bacterium]
MQIIIDLDGVICEEKPTFERPMAKPLSGAKENINNFYEQGHTIVIYSARSWPEYKMTKDWLDKNGFKYHELVLGKPVGDVWIDDRAIKFTNWEAVLEDKKFKK